MTLPIASSTTATISIDRNGDIGPVMLSATDIPGNLSIEFAQNPVPANVDTIEATITAIGGMPPGDGRRDDHR